MKIITANDSGLFANILDAMRNIYYCKQNNEQYYIRWGKESHYYDKQIGNNAWEYYFLQNKKDPIDGEIVYGYQPIPFIGKAFREYMHDVLSEHLIYNTTVHNRMHEIKKDWPLGKTIGLHIRYTEKMRYWNTGEPHSAKPLDLKTYVKYVDKLLQNGYQNIFVASDNEAAINQLSKYYTNNLVYQKNIPRSITADGISAYRTTNEDGFEAGITALLDSLCLSKCDFLIRATSNLSSFSQFLNLELEHFNINEVLCGDDREKEYGLTSTII